MQPTGLSLTAENCTAKNQKVSLSEAMIGPRVEKSEDNGLLAFSHNYIPRIILH